VGGCWVAVVFSSSSPSPSGPPLIVTCSDPCPSPPPPLAPTQAGGQAHLESHISGEFNESASAYILACSPGQCKAVSTEQLDAFQNQERVGLGPFACGAASAPAPPKGVLFIVIEKEVDRFAQGRWGGRERGLGVWEGGGAFDENGATAHPRTGPSRTPMPVFTPPMPGSPPHRCTQAPDSEIICANMFPSNWCVAVLCSSPSILWLTSVSHHRCLPVGTPWCC
jgi:hypothetical protein